MEFDVSEFSDFGAWLFATGKQVFESMNFNFGDFTLNGFLMLIGCAIVILVGLAVARILR